MKTADTRDLTDGGYGLSDRFKAEAAAAKEPEEAPEAEPEPEPAASAPPETTSEKSEAERSAEKAAEAMESVANAMARNRKTINVAADTSVEYKQWASAVDKESGGTYYYNATTRAVSWAWPPPPPGAQPAPAPAGRGRGATTPAWMEEGGVP